MDYKTDVALQVKIKDEDSNNVLDLFYAILDIDIADRWINLIDENNQRKNSIRFNYRRILNSVGIKKKLNQLACNINFINKYYDRKLSDVISVDFLRANANLLNDLHEEYEIYGNRLEELIAEGYFDNPKKSLRFNLPWPGETHNKKLHESFLLLNEQIHNFEAIFRNWNSLDSILCTCLFDFIPNKLPEDVLPEDYLYEELRSEDYFLFTTERYWGWAYLGYNTLGKHWSSASHDNDIEVVKRKQIKPQKRFAAETYLDFGLHDSNYHTRINLYNWWLENNFSDLIDPRMKLEDFAFGFIPIAKLYCYKINNGEMASITTEIDKKKWNKQVWSKFNLIESVEIINV